MKKLHLLLLLVGVLTFTSCEYVQPNYAGVLQENYGKSGKSDFTLQSGKVWVVSPGTVLFQVPLWEQRADFGDRVLHLKASDNTQFESRPVYSYTVIKENAVDVVFNNKHLGSGSDFMRSLEDNILETKIYDLMKEESRKYTTDELMANGGSLIFENKVQQIITNAFKEKGLKLESLSCQLEFSEKVKAKIDSRNEVNTNISVIDQQILEQIKRNELAELKAKENLILSRGLTKEVLTQQFIDKWDGHTSLYGSNPITNLVSNK